MDGFVVVICYGLDEVGFEDVFVMFYVVKYVFVFYGLFCDVVYFFF